MAFDPAGDGFPAWLQALKGLLANPNGVPEPEAKTLFEKRFSPVGAAHALAAKQAPPRYGKKIAILVLGAYAPLILDRVIDNFHDQNFTFFLHLDSKQNIEAYTAKMSNATRLRVVEPRIKVYWGAISMVEAEISLIKAALADPEISVLVLISDDTAPIASPDAIYQALTEHPDRITCIPNGRPRHWYDEFFYTNSDFAALRGVDMGLKHFQPADFTNILRLEKLRAKGKKRIETMYFGRQWWALSRASARAVVDFVENDEDYMESFHFSLFPDETFFPTAYRICFPSAPVIDIPTYADYGKPVHPWQFSSADEILSAPTGPEHLFVRKIKADRPDVVVGLAKTWAEKSTPFLVA